MGLMDKMRGALERATEKMDQLSEPDTGLRPEDLAEAVAMLDR